MTGLTRRLQPDQHRVCWDILYDDIYVDSIVARAGVPKDVEQWGWYCGFYPVSHRGVRAEGIAASFDEAHAAFEAAWRAPAQCSEDDFAEHRYHRAFIKWRYRMWSEGRKVPSQTGQRHDEVLLRRMIADKTSSDHLPRVPHVH